MSQRNPMNDRYQTDEHRGQTRKSAAAMKPKSKAAASVRVQPKEKTKQQKKAEKKVARQKQGELDRKYYNPPTPQYKRLRKIWWALLIGAIAATALSWICLLYTSADELRDQERLVFAMLEEFGPMRRADLQERFEFSQATLLRILGRLKDKGLVRAEGNTRRRVYRVAVEGSSAAG